MGDLTTTYEHRLVLEETMREQSDVCRERFWQSFALKFVSLGELHTNPI